MFPFEQTSIENREGRFNEVRNFFQEHGYVVGGNWDYHQGFFDKKIDDELGYLFIRIPVFMVEGEFGDDNAQLRIGTPLLLRHKFNPGLDDHAHVGNVSASFNQFQEPVDPDASLEEQHIEVARQEVKRLEQAFAETFPQ